MPTYICDKCKHEFNKKSNYDKHINRKFSCSINDVIICVQCSKTFASRSSLLRHQKTYCKKKNIIIEDNRLEINNVNITNNITHITNNITNNINIVNFGRERIDKLTENEIKQILNAGSSALTNHVKLIHFNDRLPEYKNIYISNLRGNTCLVYFNKKWINVDINDKIDDLIDYSVEDIKDLLNKDMDDNDNRYSRSQTKYLIDNIDDNNHKVLKEQRKKIKLVLYNNKDKILK